MSSRPKPRLKEFTMRLRHLLSLGTLQWLEVCLEARSWDSPTSQHGACSPLNIIYFFWWSRQSDGKQGRRHSKSSICMYLFGVTLSSFCPNPAPNTQINLWGWDGDRHYGPKKDSLGRWGVFFKKGLLNCVFQSILLQYWHTFPFPMRFPDRCHRVWFCFFLPTGWFWYSFLSSSGVLSIRSSSPCLILLPLLCRIPTLQRTGYRSIFCVFCFLDWHSNVSA